MSERKRCQGITYTRDTYRYTGRGVRGGFEMYYTKAQCTRSAADGSDMCWQHQRCGSARCEWGDENMEQSKP